MANNSVASSASQQPQLARSSNKNHEDNVNESTSTSTQKLTQSGTVETARATSGGVVIYDVEHLATFSTATSHETNNGSTNNDVDGSNGTTAAATTTTTSNGIESNQLSNATSGSIGSSDESANTSASQGQPSATSPKVALKRLFELEKLSGIWTQRMQIELHQDVMLIVDCETNTVVERFGRDCVTNPEAFNEYDDIYNNIVVFIIQQQDERLKRKQDSSLADSNAKLSFSRGQEDRGAQGELHIFQCVSHKAQKLVSDIQAWKIQQTIATSASGSEQDKSTSQQVAKNKMADDGQLKEKQSQQKSTPSSGGPQSAGKKGHHSSQSQQQVVASNVADKPVVTVASSANGSENVPIVNVNVKETVQVFNQIAALREKGKPSSPTIPPPDGPTGSSTANTDLVRSPLSPGGQLYKQRSIRATLANGNTKQSQQHEQTSSTYKSPEVEPSSSFNSASTVSSSSVASSEANNKAISYQVNNNNNQSYLGSRSNGYEGHPANPKTHSPANAASRPNSMPTGHQKAANKSSRAQPRGLSDSSQSQASSSSQSHTDQVTTNESYVSVLNHCFDDIEKFIIRLQQAVAAIRELQAKKKLSKRSSSNGFHDGGPSTNKDGEPLYGKGAFSNHHHHQQEQLTSISNKLPALSIKARGPSEDDYFEILSKFKLAFNLLAKLKGCIHEPNAPELVHFLFTPLAIIIESARNALPPIDPTLVGIPYLNQDALDLLSNCCTSKESDLWLSLGPNWTQTIDIGLLKASRLPSSFQPIFSDGWAPIIGELELIGLAIPATSIGECLGPTVDADIAGAHHHRKGRRMSQPPSAYLVNDLPADSSVYSAGMVGNGRADKSKSVSNARKGNTISPQPSIEPTMAQPQLVSPNSYGYMHHHNRDANIDPMGRDQAGFRGLDHSRNIRFGEAQQMMRRTKHSNRHHQDYPSAAGYEPAHYPAIGNAPIGGLPTLATGGDGHHIDADLIAQHNGRLHHSDDYTELHDPYLNDNHPHNVAGPSHLNYRREKSQSRYKQQHNPGHLSQRRPFDQQQMLPPYEADYMNEIDHEAMLLDFGPAQTEWFFELQARGALIVRVLFSREANNDKELSVRRGEILEVLDDTRKWWRARNIDLQIAHVPHTIVAVMHGYQTLDELLANNSGEGIIGDDPNAFNSQRFSRCDMQYVGYGNPQQWHNNEDKRNSKTAGAFRYF